MRMKYAAVMAGLALGLMTGTARAAYIIDIYQAGSDVLSFGSGSIDTTDLIFAAFGESDGGALLPSRADAHIGAGEDISYTGIIGPSNFGAGDLTYSISTTGPVVGIYFQDELLVPANYVSNTLLSPSNANFGAGTLSSLGLEEGSYIYSWGTGINADTLTVNVGLVPVISPVPLPASAPMFGTALLGLAGLGYAAQRKKSAVAA